MNSAEKREKEGKKERKKHKQAIYELPFTSASKRVLVRRQFHMEISFIRKQILVHLHVNETNFPMKGLALGLALRRR